MKRTTILTALVCSMLALTAKAQTIIPDGYTATHSDRIASRSHADILFQKSPFCISKSIFIPFKRIAHID